jgi:hypothetical protein
VDDVYLGGLLPTGVEERPVSLGFQLHQNVPNPFGQGARIDRPVVFGAVAGPDRRTGRIRCGAARGC